MASTNKTTHYELSQYVGSDKPTYLTDYNGDMLKIDNGIYSAYSKADTADGKADTADAKAVSAQNDATSALNSAGTANTNIGTMANLNTTEKSSLVGAVNEVNGKVNKLNLDTFYSFDTTAMTISDGTFISGTMRIATNSDKSIAKIYGKVAFNKTSAGATTVKFNSLLRPESDITINCAGSQFGQYNGAIDMIIRTNGDIELSQYSGTGNTEYVTYPCLYFITDFGDTPSN